MQEYQFPKSVTDPRIVIISTIAMVLTVLGFLIFAPDLDILLISLSIIAAVTLTSVLGEVFIAKSHKVDRVLRKEKRQDHQELKSEIHLTFLGISTYLFLMMLAYLFVPEYSKTDYDYSNMIFIIGAPIALLAIGFFILPYTMQWLKTDKNIYQNLGFLVIGKYKKADRELLSFITQSFLLRGFFIPFMITVFIMAVEAIFREDSIARLLFAENFDWSLGKVSQVTLVIYSLLILLDVTVGTLGYIIVTKSLNADIRSLDPKFLGWFSCLVCYPPFWDIANKTFLLVFISSVQWEVIFEGQEVVLFFWSLLVMASGGVEAFSGATFGIRFSNIAYRGLNVTGPYKFSKHPQYIGKMFHRFFVIMPFIGYVSWLDWTSGMLGFVILCLLYFLRARTEENHLTVFPEYVAYANAMNERGIFRWFGKTFPVFAYDEERSKKYHIFMR